MKNHLKLILEIAGRFSIWVILMFISWDISLNVGMNVLNWMLLVIYSVLIFIWQLLPLIKIENVK